MDVRGGQSELGRNMAENPDGGGVEFVGSAELCAISSCAGNWAGLAETIEAIDSARVTTRILYVTAHPDDESGAVLTYLARAACGRGIAVVDARRRRAERARAGAGATVWD